MNQSEEYVCRVRKTEHAIKIPKDIVDILNIKCDMLVRVTIEPVQEAVA